MNTKWRFEQVIDVVGHVCVETWIQINEDESFQESILNLKDQNEKHKIKMNKTYLFLLMLSLSMLPRVIFFKPDLPKIQSIIVGVLSMNLVKLLFPFFTYLALNFVR